MTALLEKKETTCRSSEQMHEIAVWLFETCQIPVYTIQRNVERDNFKIGRALSSEEQNKLQKYGIEYKVVSHGPHLEAEYYIMLP